MLGEGGELLSAVLTGTTLLQRSYSISHCPSSSCRARQGGMSHFPGGVPTWTHFSHCSF